MMCKELFQALARIREAGVGILLVEQNAKQEPEHRRPRLSDRNRPDRRRGHRGGAAATTRRCSAPIWAAAMATRARAQRQQAGLRASRPQARRGAMKHVSLMIGERDENAADGRHLRPHQPVHRRGRHPRRCRHRSPTPCAAADAAAAAFPAWSATRPERPPRACCSRPPTFSTPRAPEFVANLMAAETGATGRVGHFNVMLAAEHAARGRGR